MIMLTVFTIKTHVGRCLTTLVVILLYGLDTFHFRCHRLLEVEPIGTFILFWLFLAFFVSISLEWKIKFDDLAIVKLGRWATLGACMLWIFTRWLWFACRSLDRLGGRSFVLTNAQRIGESCLQSLCWTVARVNSTTVCCQSRAHPSWRVEWACL